MTWNAARNQTNSSIYLSPRTPFPSWWPFNSKGGTANKTKRWNNHEEGRGEGGRDRKVNDFLVKKVVKLPWFSLGGDRGTQTRSVPLRGHWPEALQWDRSLPTCSVTLCPPLPTKPVSECVISFSSFRSENFRGAFTSFTNIHKLWGAHSHIHTLTHKLWGVRPEELWDSQSVDAPSKVLSWRIRCPKVSESQVSRPSH